MAILAQIEQIKKESPESKVGLVTFNGGLFVIGDGSQDKIYLDGKCLTSFDLLKQHGKDQANQRLDQPIKETAKKIEKEIKSLKLAAGTALGPAVALSVSMATQGQKGSRVVICTDGQPTVGIGYYSKRFTPEQIKYTD